MAWAACILTESQKQMKEQFDWAKAFTIGTIVNLVSSLFLAACTKCVGHRKSAGPLLVGSTSCIQKSREFFPENVEAVEEIEEAD